MPIATDELSKNAMGGTELMKYGLRDRLGEEFLDDFQIICSRVRELDESRIRVLWCHDLPEDPESKHLANGGWNKFHMIVFVSNWQAQRYIEKYNIPWSKTTVLLNAIDPMTEINKPDPNTKIRMIYHTTPHRGLNVLVPVFKKLKEKHPNIHLDVFSSFKIYGWEERDKQFEPLYEEIRNDPDMTYHGFKPREEMYEHLKNAHIYSYPSTWLETSCISLMEAMSAGCMCVHPNLGALYETAANWTMMYGWQEDIQAHASLFYSVLDGAVEIIKTDTNYDVKLKGQKSYADLFYSWDVRAAQWKAMLNGLRNMPRELPKQSGQFFEYRS